MDQEALVESKVDTAIDLVRRLDAAGLKPKFAAWYLYDDANEWRLLIASLALDPLLPKQEPLAYRKVVDVLSQSGSASLGVSDLKLLATTDKLTTSLRMLIGTGPDTITRADCQDNMLNGIFVKHVIVLRSA
ncbi:MAG: hypothetical protein H7274_00715 [Rhodoferax sp.]|nr:hypothetical protein [Rhodoferax sp.]